MRKLGIYARQSREKETTGSIDDQCLKGIEKSKHLNISYAVYIDRGESAAYDNLDNRPEMVRLINDIQKGDITDVFVLDESRLTRNQHTKLTIKSIFAEHSVKVYTELDGTIDFTDSNQEFMSDIRTLFASKFVKDNAKKIQNVLKNRVIDGKAHTGILKPYGYKADDDKNLVVDEDERKVIEDIFTMCLQGLGSGRIAKELNSRGILSKGRKTLKNGINLKNRYDKEILKHVPTEDLNWVGNTVLNILKNPIYKGDRKYKGETFPAPSIVTGEVWNKVQEQIQKNKNFTGKVTHNYMLRGLCYCARCGSNFAGRSRVSKRDHYYYCTSKLTPKKCGVRSINIDYLENLVWYRIVNNEYILTFIDKKVAQLQNPEYLGELTEKRKEYMYKLNQAEGAKDRLIDLYSSQLISKDDVTKKLLQYNDQIESIKSDLEIIDFNLQDGNKARAEFDTVKEYLNRLGEMQESIDPSVRLEIIRSCVEKIVIEYDDEQEVFMISMKMSFDPHVRLDYLRKGYAPQIEHYYAPAPRLNHPSMPPSSTLSHH